MSKYFWWAAAILICVMIFSFSCENADESTETSRGLISKIIDFITADMPQIQREQLAEALDGLVRKLAHFSIFAALGFFLLGATRRSFDKYTAVITIVFCVFYAVTDEVHQLFVPGRSGQITDVLVDGSGSAAGMLVYFCMARILPKKL